MYNYQWEAQDAYDRLRAALGTIIGDLSNRWTSESLIARQSARLDIILSEMIRIGQAWVIF